MKTNCLLLASLLFISNSARSNPDFSSEALFTSFLNRGQVYYGFENDSYDARYVYKGKLQREHPSTHEPYCVLTYPDKKNELLFKLKRFHNSLILKPEEYYNYTYFKDVLYLSLESSKEGYLGVHCHNFSHPEFSLENIFQVMNEPSKFTYINRLSNNIVTPNFNIPVTDSRVYVVNSQKQVALSINDLLVRINNSYEGDKRFYILNPKLSPNFALGYSQKKFKVFEKIAQNHLVSRVKPINLVGAEGHLNEIDVNNTNLIELRFASTDDRVMIVTNNDNTWARYELFGTLRLGNQYLPFTMNLNTGFVVIQDASKIQYVKKD